MVPSTQHQKHKKRQACPPTQSSGSRRERVTAGTRTKNRNKPAINDAVAAEYDGWLRSCTAAVAPTPLSSYQPATRTHNFQELTRHKTASSIVFPNVLLNASYDPHISHRLRVRTHYRVQI
ncbi:putative retrotransposon hot spot (RHS) protein [Trypanosoma cruzi]|nr:putative retrotransposon hot spot (RHS) protein [Trypanosoma cruzi]